MTCVNSQRESELELHPSPLTLHVVLIPFWYASLKKRICWYFLFITYSYSFFPPNPILPTPWDPSHMTNTIFERGRKSAHLMIHWKSLKMCAMCNLWISQLHWKVGWGCSYTSSFESHFIFIICYIDLIFWQVVLSIYVVVVTVYTCLLDLLILLCISSYKSMFPCIHQTSFLTAR